MLRQSSELIGYSVRATDGLIGTVSDLLFDDESWTLRWAVVDTGEWLSGREVLLPPSAFGTPDAERRHFPMDLTRRQIEDSPELSEHEPVSRQKETELYSHYGWLPYWYPGTDPMSGAPGYPGYVPLPGGAGPAVSPTAGGPARMPPEAVEGQRAEGDDIRSGLAGEPHLRSIKEVTEYYVHATDGDIGHIEEFLIEDGSWTIRYLVVDTKNWWPGKMVLVSPEWIDSINWGDEHVYVRQTREQIRTSPEYDPSVSVERAYEERLHGHYNAPNYWD
jgi:hypothetical protein